MKAREVQRLFRFFQKVQPPLDQEARAAVQGLARELKSLQEKIIEQEKVIASFAAMKAELEARQGQVEDQFTKAVDRWTVALERPRVNAID